MVSLRFYGESLMKLWAVSMIDWGDCVLRTEFYAAETWKEALGYHSAYSGRDIQEWLRGMPVDIENAKRYAFSVDIFEVVEVPERNPRDFDTETK